MIYGKELAPNLFSRFKDWYVNFVCETGREPTNDELQDAVTYYKNLEKEKKNGQPA